MVILHKGFIPVFVAAVTVLFCSTNTYAVTRDWVSTSSTDWSVADNWIASGVPGATDEARLGLVGTVNPVFTATPAIINGLLISDGKAVNIDVGAFQLRNDAGYATPIASTVIDVAPSSFSHTITGDKTGTADYVFSKTNNSFVIVGAGTSLTFDATVGVIASSASSRILKQGDGLMALGADSSATWTLSGNPSTSQKSLTVRGGPLLLASVGARGANTNSVSVFEGDGTFGQGKATLRLAANFGDLVNYGGTNNTECILELSGRGWQGGVDSTGEGALNNVSGHNSITAAEVNGGRVTFANNGNFSDDVRIRIEPATSLTVSAPIVPGIVFGGHGGGAPNFEKTGGGLLVFNGSEKSYSGNTILKAGTLQFDANYTGGGNFSVENGATLSGSGAIATPVSLDAGGILAPGTSIESLSVGGASGAGKLLIEYSGGPGTDQIDALNVTGSLNINAMTLDFNSIGSALNDTAVVFATYGSLSGTAFSSVLDTPAGYTINYNYLGGNQIALVASLRPGDFDSDGDVDGADFVAWQTNFPKATGATLAQGDADGDGDVDGADFVVWQTNFPFTPGPGASPVPEPGLLVFAITAFGTVGLIRWRRPMESLN
jgi:autotransporter-associated beta strand protein